MNKRLRICSITVNFLIVIIEVLLMVFVVFAPTGTGTDSFRFFTNDSNILVGLTCLAAGVLDLVYLLKGKSTPSIAIILKLIGTVTMAITFLISWCVLTPTSRGLTFVLDPSSFLWLHTVVPTLAIGSFIFLDALGDIKQRLCVLGTAPLVVYGVPILILIGTRTIEPPYPFLDILNTPWYLEVVYLILILGLSVGVSFLLIIVRNGMKKVYLGKK